jgi:eukaryotic-like serine/threonine-protein kinase
MDRHHDIIRQGLADRYRLIRELGRGGMATVFLAEDLRHRRPVAIKVLDPATAQQLGAERFLREIETAARLNHPNILPLHDSGQVRGADGSGPYSYYVMPFVEGESLRDRLSREKQLPVEDALRIAGEVAAALSHAHEHGVVHRDVKPENILLREGHAVVSDFGIARAVTAAGGDRLTRTGLAVGTPTYMSPEQVASSDVDPRMDVYSLGCVLYEMLAGDPPYAASTPQAVLARKLAEPAPSLRIVRDAVPPAVERAVAKALARTPADRFPTAADFAAALEDAVARPEGGPRSRRRLAVVAGVAVLVLLTGWWAFQAVAPADAAIRSLAVLPFENLSGDPDQEYFVAGMHDALIGELGAAVPLRIISRRSVMRYRGSDMSVPEIARELNVDGVIEGSVRRSGDTVHMRVQLMRVLREEENLWTATYERRVHDVASIHRDVTHVVAQRLRVALSAAYDARAARRRDIDPDVYEAYLRGMHLLSQPVVEERYRGIEYLHGAVQRDPGNARAYAGLALGYASLGHDDALVPDALPRARAAALRAATLDPELAEAQAALAEVMIYYERDWERAEEAFERALDLNPSLAMTHYHYSWFLLLFDRVEEAIAAHLRAQELDPLTVVHTSDLGTLYAWIGRGEDALTEARRSLERNPDAFRGLYALGVACTENGLEEEAIAAHRRLAAVNPRWQWPLGVTYARFGRTAEAREIAAELESSPPSTWNAFGLAILHAALGDSDAAFRWLDYEQPHAWLPWIRLWPDFRPLRADPRFAELLRRYRLPPVEALQTVALD